jgi:MFS family permease
MTVHQYLTYFGYKQSGASSGFVFVSYNIGNIIGAFFAGAICDRVGHVQPSTADTYSLVVEAV